MTHKHLSTDEVKWLAEELHAKHKTRGGKKYFGHCLRVAEKAGELYLKHAEAGAYINNASSFYQVRQVGYLHDALEDCVTEEGPLTELDLCRKGVHPFVVEAVSALTKTPGQDYIAYLNVVRDDPLARWVKMADLDHNARLSRMNMPLPGGDITDSMEELEKTLARMRKYALSYLYLEPGREFSSNYLAELIRDAQIPWRSLKTSKPRRPKAFTEGKYHHPPSCDCSHCIRPGDRY